MHKITALPIVILMPHSACNCRCVMCDIWKGNQHLKQLTEKDIAGLMSALQRFGTRQVLMTGGEALLNPNFFALCALLKNNGIKISLHSTGLTIKKHVHQLVKWVDDVIVSLDGDEATHNRIRNIPGAFYRLKEGLESLRSVAPQFPVTGRTVIHRQNFRRWGGIVEAAKVLGLDRISFLPADVSATAFNRDGLWSDERQHDLLLSREELTEMRSIIDELVTERRHDFESRFIAEAPQKLDKIYQYYAAFYGLNDFPFKRCNAPWVSTVVEADGTVRPCFFHEAYGNLASGSLNEVINSESAIRFRKHLDIANNDVCKRCVCYLNLSPLANFS
jgi:MoaA/NifB/PqqE/SkfB family radical SAM enzyme